MDAQTLELIVDGVAVERAVPGVGKRRVLADVSFAARGGELTLVLGRSGAGKTTLLEMIAGLVPALRGKVAIQGCGEVNSARADRRGVTGLARSRLGLLFQFPERQLFAETPWLDVLAQDPPPSRSAAELALRGVELPESKWHVRVHSLSRGEKRRVALAGILARSPTVVLLDEPAVGLDVEGRRLLRAQIESVKAAGAILLVASHWAGDFLGAAGQVVCLDQGEVVFRGTPAMLVEHALSESRILDLLPFGERLWARLRRTSPVAEQPPRWGIPVTQALARLLDIPGPENTRPGLAPDRC